MEILSDVDFGKEKAVSVQGKDQAAIIEELQKLIKLGETMPRYCLMYMEGLKPHCTTLSILVNVSYLHYNSFKFYG